MKEFTIKTNDGNSVTFNFPNTIDELSQEYLLDVTKPIVVADNYSLLALVYSERLSRIILTAKTKKKDTKIKITPIFVKAGNTNIEFINNAKCKDRVCIMPSQLSLGVHINVPYHKLTLDYFVTILDNSSDKNIYDNELQKDDQRDCIFVEFKLVPNSDIIAFTKEATKINNNYININK